MRKTNIRRAINAIAYDCNLRANNNGITEEELLDFLIYRTNRLHQQYWREYYTNHNINKFVPPIPFTDETLRMNIPQEALHDTTRKTNKTG